MQKSSAIPKSTISYNVIKKTLVGLALGMSLTTPLTYADELLTDNYIVQGSICVGLDCVNGESFNYDTIRMRENNTRIKFHDSSSTSSFPSNDWQLTANDSGNGGANKFSIEDITGSKVPFTLTAGAPTNSIFVTKVGNVGFNTGAPLVNLHVKYGNSPTLRLDQDGSSGFTAQAWDVGGNEGNFFVRDVTGGNKLPLMIRTGAPNASLYVDTDGDIGFETTTPDGQFDVAHASNPNDHAFLINPQSLVGINIDNGFNPKGLLDVQTTGGLSKFTVTSAGNIGLGTASPTGRFDVRNLANTSSYLTVDVQGDLGIGTATPVGRFEIKSSDGTNSLLTVNDSGQIGIGTNTFGIYAGIKPKLVFEGENTGSGHNGIAMNSPDGSSSSIVFTRNTNEPTWSFSARNQSPGDDDGFYFYDTAFNHVLTLHQGGAIGMGVEIPNAGKAVEHSNGAYLSTGGAWMDASSRDLKENIIVLSKELAFKAFEELMPVKFNYITEPEDEHIGFVAEDVPDLVATPDRKALSSMDIVGVLTRVLQEQQKIIIDLQQRVEEMELNNK